MKISAIEYNKVINDIKKNNAIYAKILRIGQTFIDTGVSYNKVKTLLENDGYDFENSCIEIAVKQWFFDSFHHKGEDGKKVELEDLDNHLDCNFILKGDAGLTLADYDTSKMNLNIARKAMIISIIALIASIITPYLSTDQAEKQVQPITKVIIVKDTVYIEKSSVKKNKDTISMTNKSDSKKITQ
ncbi:hypothetical protein MW871_16025 [Flavobacterium sp. I-SCBP12n]|uniref:Uncharacterized protein n=1 Tax=Flavobacterium pygoscelis TaxID=2893176 RepID=A0A9X1XT66_9FLAO|nr:hypothetical protein [Flavobacterium pygoscelis]MCK8143400.1 hypothetical protein [Flavobacterium pygoscelis]